MTVYIALLRATNLGGQGKLVMAELRAVLSEAGFDGARTLLQTGNVVFRSKTKATSRDLERALERATADRLGLNTDVFVRTAAEWKGIVAFNPFPEESARDPSHVVVVTLKAGPAKSAVE